MTRSLTVELPPAWLSTRQVRAAVQELLESYPEPLREAAIMVASELAENAIKYGEPVPALDQARVSLCVDAERLLIEAQSGASSPATHAELVAQLALINDAPDRELLYQARLQELGENPSDTGKLGLYRVGCEGGFHLSCSYLDQVLTVSASRSLDVSDLAPPRSSSPDG